MKRTEIQRARIALRGALQGVGFRPFVYRLATELKLNGWVNNSGQGVFIEIEGEPDLIARFLKRLQTEKPARSVVSFSWGGALPGHWGIHVLGSRDSPVPRHHVQSLRFSDRIVLFRGH